MLSRQWMIEQSDRNAVGKLLKDVRMDDALANAAYDKGGCIQIFGGKRWLSVWDKPVEGCYHQIRHHQGREYLKSS